MTEKAALAEAEMTAPLGAIGLRVFSVIKHTACSSLAFRACLLTLPGVGCRDSP